VDERVWKVGELAAATGLTVRTLHHFDEIGLLRPTGRSAAGHRLYTAVDARRLSHVLVLRELGMPLREIGRSLDADPDTLAEAVREHLAQAQQRIGAQQQVRRQLRAALRALRETPESTVDGLIDTMEALMKRTYFTPEQLAALKQRHREAGAGGFR
jgi:MerR family transcriptional regulator, thiopeptide resistance regulator